MTAEITTAGSRKPGWFTWKRVGAGLGVAVVTIGLAGAFAGPTVAGGWGFRNHGHWGMSGEAADPAVVKERIGRMVAHLAIEIDATEDQKQKLTAIFTAAADDLLPLRAKVDGRAAALELAGLLTAPTVDAAAVETFRSEKLAMADQATKRMAQALVDAANVLTPEQRAKIGDRVEFFAKFGPGFHRG